MRESSIVRAESALKDCLIDEEIEVLMCFVVHDSSKVAQPVSGRHASIT